MDVVAVVSLAASTVTLSAAATTAEWATGSCKVSNRSKGERCYGDYY